MHSLKYVIEKTYYYLSFLLYKNKKKMIILNIFLIILINSSIIVSNSTDEDTIYASWYENHVIIDGRYTIGLEWSECHRYFLKLGANDGTEAPFSIINIWVKNDNDYLYILFRLSWLDSDYDTADQGFLYYLWMTQNGSILNNNSDAAWARLYGQTKDMCNYTSGEWALDTDLGGTSDAIGYGRYDGSAYWFEFKKKLNSTDICDWAFIPGQLIGANYSLPIVDDKLVIGFWDHSKDLILSKPFSLKLSRDPSERINVGGDLTDENPFGLSYLLLIAIFIIGISVRKIVMSYESPVSESLNN